MTISQIRKLKARYQRGTVRLPGPPPPVLCAARVLTYAVIPEDVPFTDKASTFVGKEPLGRVPCVAVAETLQATGHDDLLLVHCDEHWNVIALGGGEMHRVKRRMELNYPGVSALWIDLNTPRDVALKYFDEHISDWRCTVCCKRIFDVDVAIGEGKDGICLDCAESTQER